jgi:hypothetical protein
LDIFLLTAITAVHIDLFFSDTCPKRTAQLIAALPKHYLTNIQKINIYDRSGRFRSMPKITAFLKNCVNLKDFQINSNDSKLSESFSQFFPAMPCLETVNIYVTDVDIEKQFQVIYDECLNLTNLIVRKNHLAMAEEIFGFSGVKFGLNDVDYDGFIE